MDNDKKKNESGSSISIVAALGNMGDKYEFTRHNIAWLLIERLSFYSQLDWHSKFNGLYAPYRLGDEVIFFLKPMTFMNLSGQSVAALMKFYKLKPSEVLVIHDDLELDFGTIGFKRGGGLGGHNGLRSLNSCLGTPDFNRLRLGISRPPHTDITSYVLGPFSRQEQEYLPSYLDESARLLELCLEQGFDSMEKPYRKKNLLA